MEEQGEGEAWRAGAVGRAFGTAADGSIEALLDHGSPFMELSSLAAQDVYPDPLPGAGLVTGIGESQSRGTLLMGRTRSGAEVHGDRQ